MAANFERSVKLETHRRKVTVTTESRLDVIALHADIAGHLWNEFAFWFHEEEDEEGEEGTKFSSHVPPSFSFGRQKRE